MEAAAHAGIEGLRLRFEEVTKRNGLHGNTELAAELADMITRPGGVTVGHVAAVYQARADHPRPARPPARAQPRPAPRPRSTRTTRRC